MLVHKDHRVAHNLGAAPARGKLWGYAGESPDALGEPIALGAGWRYAVDGTKSTHQLFDARPADASLADVAVRRSPNPRARAAAACVVGDEAEAQSPDRAQVRYVQLAFDANHGHPDYTCVSAALARVSPRATREASQSDSETCARPTPHSASLRRCVYRVRVYGELEQ